MIHLVTNILMSSLIKCFVIINCCQFYLMIWFALVERHVSGRYEEPVLATPLVLPGVGHTHRQQVGVACLRMIDVNFWHLEKLAVQNSNRLDHLLTYDQAGINWSLVYNI